MSPMFKMHQEAGAVLLPYGMGEREGGAADDGVGPPVDVVAAFGPIELEYAALRKHCVLVDFPQLAALEATGADRVDFLNRMVTQELKGFAAKDGVGLQRRTFWLNRKGRIDADLRLIELGDRMLMETDVHTAGKAAATLRQFVITEDVTIADATPTRHRLGLYGPTARRLLGLASGKRGDELPRGDTCVVLTIAGAEVVCFADDLTGEDGFGLIASTADTVSVVRALIELGHDPEHRVGNAGDGPLQASRRIHPPASPASEIRMQFAGWFAVNVARIEAGNPLYNIDFGPESLPAESGVLEKRVSFTKGCYLGQEVVARMHSRGHSKQVIRLASFESVEDPDTGLARVPVAGLPILIAPEAEGAEPVAVGGISSSTLAPMSASRPIALVAVKQAHAADGTRVYADGGGVVVSGTLSSTLATFVRKPDAP